MKRLALPIASAIALCFVACPDDDDDATVDPTPWDDDDALDDDDVTEIAPCDAFGPPEDAGDVNDNDLDEISGIAVSRVHDNWVWVHMDSGGGEPLVTALTYKGRTIGTVVLPYLNIDWEDIAVGPCDPQGGSCVWVADIGDNDEERNSLGLIRFAEPTNPPDTDEWRIQLKADRFPFKYPSGKHDAEALVIGLDGSPAILTKRDDGEMRVYQFDINDMSPGVEYEPERLDNVRTVPEDLGEGAQYAVTAADMWPDGSRLLIRTLGQAREFLVTNGDLGTLSIDASVQIETAEEEQGEAIAYDVRLRGIRHVAEQSDANLFFLPCTDGQ